MPNYPYMNFGCTSFSFEIEERYNNWYNEVYSPEIFMKAEGVRERRRYKELESIGKNAQYISIAYNENERHLRNNLASEGRRIYDADRDKTFAGKFELIWRAQYELIKYVVKDPSIKVKPHPEGTVLHIEAYKMPPEDEERYITWLSRFGYDSYLQLLMKSTGLIEYSHHKLVPIKDQKATAPIKDPDNPRYLSLFHFHDAEDYHAFIDSLEFTLFRERIKSGFQAEIRWSGGYQIVKIWRK